MVGISKWRHHPQQQQQQTTSMADVTSVWHLFDSNVRIVEWFSLLIIKTVLDRYRQVVNTNTCVLFYRYIISLSLSLPTYSKTNKNQALLVWQQQLVATRRTTSPSSQGCDVIHSLTRYLMHSLTLTLTLTLTFNLKYIVKQNQIKMTRTMVWF